MRAISPNCFKFFGPLALLLCLGFTSSCSDTGSEGAELGLQLKSVKLTRMTKAEKASAGSYWAVFEIELSVAAGSDALVVGRPAFKVTTDAGLRTPPSAFATTLSDCPEAELVAGKSISCSIIFELKDSERPTELGYDEPSAAQRKASVTVPAQNCDFCGNDCIDLITSKLTPCGEDCADLRFDPRHCGACHKSVEPDSCTDGKRSCNDPTEQVCGDACVKTTTDKDNCGSCDKKCQEYCVSSKCVVVSSKTCVGTNNCAKTCAEHCSASGCVNGRVYYSGGLCSSVSDPLACSALPTPPSGCSLKSIDCTCLE